MDPYRWWRWSGTARFTNHGISGTSAKNANLVEVVEWCYAYG